MKNHLLWLAICLPLPLAAQMSPTAAQHRQLVAQKHKVSDLQLKVAKAQADLQRLAAKAQARITALQVQQAFEFSQLQLLARRIVVENRWPENTQSDMQSLLYAVPAPAVAPAAAPAPPSPKKEQEKEEDDE